MANAGRRATAALAGVIAMMVAGRVSANDGPIAATGQAGATIVLHVANDAALSRAVLDEAKARAASVYAVIGVRTVWVDGGVTARHTQDGRLHLNVVLLSREMAEKKISTEGIKGVVFGQANAPSGRAYIFCDRIATMAGTTPFSTVLGDVIAHELGHLLLPPNSHSHTGIMRASVNVHANHFESFDATQADAVRTTLMAAN